MFSVFYKSRWRNSHGVILRRAILPERKHQHTVSCTIYCSAFMFSFFFIKKLPRPTISVATRTSYCQGVEMVLANWAKLPRTLFAKAWVTTGHVSKEKMMEVANIDEAEWEACNIQGDGSGLITHLGPLASDEPSIEELIQNGAMKRKRVLWTISRSSSEEPSAVLPGSLVWPVERRLSSFLFAQASAESDSLKTWTTIVISRRAGKEVSTDLLRKRTKVNADGTRAFMAGCAKPNIEGLLHNNRVGASSIASRCGMEIVIYCLFTVLYTLSWLEFWASG